MIEELINKSSAYYCVECRKCSSICPVTRVYGKFSPASIVERALIGIDDEVLKTGDIWKCLSCGLCHMICPSGVDFLSFIREVRIVARENENFGIATHEGIFESLPKLTMERDIEVEWMKEVETNEKSNVLYFAGCLPFFDVIFKEVGFDGKKIAEGTVSLLNKYGIKPSVVYGCCGHDAFWNGNEKLFKSIVKKNLEKIKEKNADKIIFSCPECYSVFKKYYPKIDAQLMHISEFMAGKEIEKKEDGREYTFHDSCRLGKHLGIYDEPREVLKKAGIEIKEMEHNREMAVCCGTSTWMGCDWKSEEIRKNRIDEALKVADVMITTCPKCQIHFKCTLSHYNENLKVKDFVEVIAERIK